MQKNDMVEKVKLVIDGVERNDLISVEELSSEKAIVEVPEYAKKRKLTNGVIDIPLLVCVFKVPRDSDTIKFFSEWYHKNQVKDCIKIRTDAHGVEFGRTLFPSCECAKYTETGYDASNPAFTQVSTILAPWDFIPQL